MKLDAIKVDPTKNEAGVWIEARLLDPRLRGVQLKVRGFDNRDDLRIRSEEIGKLPFHLTLPGAERDEVVEEKIMTARLVGAILTDWQGITGDDDRPEPYSREAAERYLADPAYGVFRDVVIRAATLVRGGYAAKLEADAGN